MVEPLDITGKKFNRLTAIKYVGVDNHHYKTWLFKCECGNTTVKSISAVLRGKVKSCGCAELARQKNFIKKYAGVTKHGQSYTRLYTIWRGMKQRCGRKPRYENVFVCDEWQEFKPFYEWALANGYQDNLSIDRINNKGNYEPNNCRWATVLQQQNNTSLNWNMTYMGETKTASEWARELGINPCCFYYWRRKGSSDEDILRHFLNKGGKYEGVN